MTVKCRSPVAIAGLVIADAVLASEEFIAFASNLGVIDRRQIPMSLDEFAGSECVSPWNRTHLGDFDAVASYPDGFTGGDGVHDLRRAVSEFALGDRRHECECSRR